MTAPIRVCRVAQQDEGYFRYSVMHRYYFYLRAQESASEQESGAKLSRLLAKPSDDAITPRFLSRECRLAQCDSNPAQKHLTKRPTRTTIERNCVSA